MTVNSSCIVCAVHTCSFDNSDRYRFSLLHADNWARGGEAGVHRAGVLIMSGEPCPRVGFEDRSRGQCYTRSRIICGA